MSETNLLTLTVSHNVDWSESDEGRIVLSCPRITNPFFKKIFKPFIRKEKYTVTLDEYGSFVWTQINGKDTVERIASALLEHFGEKINPVYDRLGLFLRILAKNKYIIIHSE